MISLRCSGLPLLFQCPQSANDDLRVSTANEASALGSSAHEAMESVVYGRSVDTAGIARRWSVDEDELGVMVHFGRKAWAELAPSFPDPETEMAVEVSVPPFEMTGHIDLVSVSSDGSRASILDYKTGRIDGDYFHQLAGYAACLILGQDFEHVTASVVWLRDQDVETYVFTVQDVEAWMLRLISVLSQRTGEYRTGSHCAYCPRSHSCPAVAASGRAAVALFGRADMSAESMAATLQAMPPADRVKLYRQAKLVSTLADAAKAAVRLNVIQNGGTLDAGDGRELRIVEKNGKRVINTLGAWPIIESLDLSDIESATILTISAAALDDVVAKKAGKGNGAAAKRELAVKLEDAGALKQGKIQKLKDVRKK